ncbi:MAG: hydantoinase/oxoprolinase family protein [Hyphomicrobiaceae bacterium]
MSLTHQLRLAVDIGGTFTDAVLVAGNGEVLATTKTLTTHDNPTKGALASVRDVFAQADKSLGDVSGFIHGTTLATNALIERRGACVASITTGGFRDILEIAYERRHSQYDIDFEKPDLIVPRSRCFTIPERISVSGQVIEHLDEAAVDELITPLDGCRAESVAICLLHSYANPEHEQKLRALLHSRRPNLSISLSSDVSPEASEFDRLCTTIANAYVKPLMSAYLTDFAEVFAAEGLQCPVLMMTSGGGMTTLETAAQFPIRLVESGPAGGAILAAQIAERCGLNRVLSFDMGGTTAKLCLIDEYRPRTARHFEISRAERFIKGSGMPVRIPVVEMIEIGAGGGSIAGVDRLGRPTVGPTSAGSEPGPACFGKGGTQPTVTDADLVLGYIDPRAFAEGKLRADMTAAEEALRTHVGEPLGLDAAGAADGVSQIVDENMANAARMHAVESGKDVGGRTMIAFGGNGPLHATRLARRAGIDRIVVPRDPGVGSAIGFLHAPVSYEIVRSRYAKLDTLDVEQINELFETLISEAEKVVRAGAPDEELLSQRIAFMRYHGQGHEVEIILANDRISHDDIPTMRAAFEAEYRRQFARSVPGMEIEILNWAVRVSTKVAATATSGPETGTTMAKADGKRAIICDVTGAPVEAAVYHRARLRHGDFVVGPALIVEPQTTTLVSVDFDCSVDWDNNLHLKRLARREKA